MTAVALGGLIACGLGLAFVVWEAMRSPRAYHRKRESAFKRIDRARVRVDDRIRSLMDEAGWPGDGFTVVSQGDYEHMAKHGCAGLLTPEGMCPYGFGVTCCRNSWRSETITTGMSAAEFTKRLHHLLQPKEAPMQNTIESVREHGYLVRITHSRMFVPKFQLTPVLSPIGAAKAGAESGESIFDQPPLGPDDYELSSRGGETIVAIFRPDEDGKAAEIMATGVSITAMSDTYCKATGRLKAFGRAYGALLRRLAEDAEIENLRSATLEEHKALH